MRADGWKGGKGQGLANESKGITVGEWLQLTERSDKEFGFEGTSDVHDGSGTVHNAGFAGTGKKPTSNLADDDSRKRLEEKLTLSLANDDQVSRTGGNVGTDPSFPPPNYLDVAPLRHAPSPEDAPLRVSTPTRNIITKIGNIATVTPSPDKGTSVTPSLATPLRVTPHDASPPRPSRVSIAVNLFERRGATPDQDAESDEQRSHTTVSPLAAQDIESLRDDGGPDAAPPLPKRQPTQSGSAPHSATSLNSPQPSPMESDSSTLNGRHPPPRGDDAPLAVSRQQGGGKAEFVPGTNLRVQRGDGGAVGGEGGPGTVLGSDGGEIKGARVLRVSRREDEGVDRGSSQVVSPGPGDICPTPGGSEVLSPSHGKSQVLSPSASASPTARVLKCRVIEQQHGSRTRGGNTIENAPAPAAAAAAGGGGGVGGVGGVGVGDGLFEGGMAEAAAGKKPCVAEVMTLRPPMPEVVYEGAESDLKAAREEEEEEQRRRWGERGVGEGGGGGGVGEGGGGVDEYRAVEERCEGLFIKGNVKGGWQLITLAIPEELRIATLVKLR